MKSFSHAFVRPYDFLMVSFIDQSSFRPAGWGWGLGKVYGSVPPLNKLDVCVFYVFLCIFNRSERACLTPTIVFITDFLGNNCSIAFLICILSPSSAIQHYREILCITHLFIMFFVFVTLDFHCLFIKNALLYLTSSFQNKYMVEKLDSNCL